MSNPFVFDPSPVFPGVGKISLHGGLVGEIPVSWRHKGRKAMEAWIQSIDSDGAQSALRDVLVDWSVVNAAGEALPLTDETLRDLLDAYPASGSELCESYVRDLTRGRLGN